MALLLNGHADTSGRHRSMLRFESLEEDPEHESSRPLLRPPSFGSCCTRSLSSARPVQQAHALPPRDGRPDSREAFDSRDRDPWGCSCLQTRYLRSDRKVLINASDYKGNSSRGSKDDPDANQEEIDAQERIDKAMVEADVRRAQVRCTIMTCALMCFMLSSFFGLALYARSTRSQRLQEKHERSVLRMHNRSTFPSEGAPVAYGHKQERRPRGANRLRNATGQKQAEGTAASENTSARPQKRPGDSCNFDFPGGDAVCFCQFAGNKGCAGEACTCPQGCEGNAWPTERTSTFINIKQAELCEDPMALITISKSYVKHIDYLLDWCPDGARSLLAEMLQSGFDTYQANVRKGPVRQCIHAASRVSVPWLHIHTFCDSGQVDSLQDTSEVGWCDVVHDASDVKDMAQEIIDWALHGRPMPEQRNFSSCRSMGCGEEVPKPLCSCTKDCRELTIEGAAACCTDYKEACKP